ncbi:similar to dual-specificity protein phosphatase [Cyanidioschyzon merolae strain 10D]|uniref:Similar to dual-specificity protein phosphatase n=1 Tax=Cyanidioschyzon merolae (strain NIES-3377 / 10D) TaxID=280699 RepID=M1VI78_CYAM1|nr:similar to dual-specificity protein phosphatase [Cyanidioschyzon merolae strain 10D]BAM80733.1 similar to dual-specificity protein phosphatase [Cyanidioschyzon merolae strain 10D]|eukprot:XP_005536769.1 similar to dual-specificity protein phosphatase [Cyanidioschyzon merolae strain 10D]
MGLYYCKRCGEVLFSAKDLVGHSNGRDQQSGTCTSLFTEPLDWVDAVGRNQGRIYCQRCTFCVGRFCWSGMPCSCGEWVRPAFQFHSARIEVRGVVKLVPKQH